MNVPFLDRMIAIFAVNVEIILDFVKTADFLNVVALNPTS